MGLLATISIDVQQDNVSSSDIRNIQKQRKTWGIYVHTTMIQIKFIRLNYYGKLKIAKLIRVTGKCAH